jgi:glycosyltransferase involved in cell wall biosynthesis
LKTPLLSALIPNYNHGRYLKQCLAGLVAQTLTDFEIIITDDGSTDGSQDIIREYATRDSRIKPNFFPKNRGIDAVTRELHERTTGKYIYTGASDDFVLNKDFFQRAVTVLEADPRPAGYYAITGIFVAETEKLAGAMGTAEVEGYNTGLQCCEGLLKYRSVVTSPSCIWRRDLFNQHSGPDINELVKYLGPQVDYYLNHELAWRYGMFFEKIPVACQRIYQARTNYSANLDIFALAARLCEMEKRLRKIGLNYPDMEKDWMRWRAVNLLDSIKKSGVQL